MSHQPRPLVSSPCLILVSETVELGGEGAAGEGLGDRMRVCTFPCDSTYHIGNGKLYIVVLRKRSKRLAGKSPFGHHVSLRCEVVKRAAFRKQQS